jgi:hypothetical protein
MSESLRPFIASQVVFEGIDNSKKFLQSFAELYRIELFKDGLDLILTKLQQKEISFEVRIINGWDTNLGCFLTEQKNFYDPLKGQFLRLYKPKIILRNLSHNLMAHEMAHALEFESGLNFGDDFRKCIGLDMKDREAQILTLRGEVQRLMVDALKAYPSYQFLSELFARYFELLSLSRNVIPAGSFATSDVTGFFANTTNFIEKIFNPQIRKKINPEIAKLTAQIAAQSKLEAPQKQFTQSVDPFQKRVAGSWSKNLRSNASWHQAWQKGNDEKK